MTEGFRSIMKNDWSESEELRLSSSESSNVKGTPEELKAEIQQLVDNGTLKPGRDLHFTRDDAAKAVLEAVTPLGQKYGLEIGGEIYAKGKYYTYSIPRVGTNGSFTPHSGNSAYHTHPSGKLWFSNSRYGSKNYDEKSNDIRWLNAQPRGTKIYLGVMEGKNVGISVCSYNAMGCGISDEYATGKKLQ